MRYIQVKFKNESETIGYTTNIWSLLVTDPDVEFIIDEKTGEILYTSKN